MNISKKPADRCTNCPKRHLSAFKNLPESICDSFDSIRQPQTLKANQVLSFTKNGLDGFYCVQKGHIKLSHENIETSGVVRICGPGDLVGYDTSSPLSSAQMLDEVGQLCFFNKSEFLKIQNAEPTVALAIIEALSKIINLKNETIIGLQNHCVKNRVASTLLNLVNKFGLQTKNGLLIDTKIDRKTLAQLAGTVTESLSRALTELQDDKIISRQGRSIFILNKEKLSQEI